MCLAHKMHCIASRTWHHCQDVLSGLVHTLSISTNYIAIELSGQSDGKMIETRCRLIKAGTPEAVLSQEAVAYRKQVLETFFPRRKHRRKWANAMFFSIIYNGNWLRRNELHHVCFGCCASRADAVVKMKWGLRMFLKSHPPSRLCKGNWLEWHKPVTFVGLLSSCHNFLGDAYLALPCSVCIADREERQRGQFLGKTDTTPLPI